MKHTHETRWLASELKFLVTPGCADGLKNWARRHLEADPFATPEMGDAYLTTSLYFDTPQFDVFHQKGSYGSAKYRVRRYGRADQAFLERKLRNHRLVVKRRSNVGIGELQALDNGAPPDAAWEGYWFHRRIVVRGLRPVCQVAYQRTARTASSETGPIRLTIDEDLRAVSTQRPVFDHQQPGVDLLRDMLVVEMKFREALPELFRNAMEEFGLEPRTVSKYKMAARHLGLAQTPQPVEAVAQTR